MGSVDEAQTRQNKGLNDEFLKVLHYNGNVSSHAVLCLL